ncbi:hypothetical protein LC593_34390 [Nostoc sp. CHAB 5844]|nr:hypothetical protein [Nostoc sp. CHAB 5844]
MPYFAAEINVNGGKLEVKYYTETGVSSNPEEATIFDKKQDAEFEVLRRDTEGSIISIPEQAPVKK